MTDKNPFNICTLDEHLDCGSCDLKKNLHCKFESKYLVGFIIFAIPFFFLAFFGMIFTGLLSGNWFFLIIYVVFVVLFFTVIEMRILCRHCPYYAREGKIIHCHANEGLPRLWKYDPLPLNRVEKLAFLTCLGFLGFFPIFAEIYGIWFVFINYVNYGVYALLGLVGLGIGTLIAILVWLAGLQLFYCPFCVNFSCPLNKVPKDYIAAYLEKNSVIKEAWEKGGYKLENERIS